MLRDDVLGARLGRFESRFEIWPQFGKDGNQPRRTAVVVFSLGTPNGHKIPFPIDVAPAEGQVF